MINSTATWRDIAVRLLLNGHDARVYGRRAKRTKFGTPFSEYVIPVNHALLVPIHLDSMYLQSDRLVVEAMADFSKLPYVDRHLKREVNAEHANISESIVSQPFQSQNLHLKAGVHLHWSMPDALTRGIQHGDETQFPALPNRWLVTRSKNGERKSWVVESDYVFALPGEKDPHYEEYSRGDRARSGSISYFYHEIDRYNFPLVRVEESSSLDYPAEPFRYVGRQVPLELWPGESQPPSSSHFPTNKPLTALGYGELAFAAFYPNCHSVFGFHDDDAKVVADTLGFRYEIIGWHSHSDHDPVKRLLLGEAILNAFQIDGSVKDQDRAGKTARRVDLLDACFDADHSASRKQLSDIIDGLIRGDSLRSKLREFLARQSEDVVGAGLVFF